MAATGATTLMVAMKVLAGAGVGRHHRFCLRRSAAVMSRHRRDPLLRLARRSMATTNLAGGAQPLASSPSAPSEDGCGGAGLSSSSWLAACVVAAAGAASVLGAAASSGMLFAGGEGGGGGGGGGDVAGFERRQRRIERRVTAPLGQDEDHRPIPAAATADHHHHHHHPNRRVFRQQKQSQQQLQERSPILLPPTSFAAIGRSYCEEEEGTRSSGDGGESATKANQTGGSGRAASVGRKWSVHRRMFSRSVSALHDEDHDEDDHHHEDDDKDVADADGGGEDFGIDSYPNFARFGSKALLPRYLTPKVYEQLRGRKTAGGVRLDDITRAGTSLPYGAHPLRGLAGVFVGDADSYKTFEPLLLPLIRDHLLLTPARRITSASDRRRTQQRRTDAEAATPNVASIKAAVASAASAISGISGRTRRLQRHESNLNYKQLLSDKLDEDGRYILYTRMRLARSIGGYRFAPCISRGERRRVENLVKECVSELEGDGSVDDDSPVDDGGGGGGAKAGKYVSVMDMTNAQHDDLIQRRILFHDPDEFALSAGLGRDWPDGRGIYCDTWEENSMPHVIIWCNAEDHLWIISNAKGGDVQGVFTKLSQTAHKLESALRRRGRSFVEDPQLGFLNCSPDHVGTALRASVYVKLVNLSKQPGFWDLVHRLRLEARSDYEETDKRFTGIYDMANAESLGKSEVDLINIMIRGVKILIELEKRLESGDKTVDLSTVAV